MAWAWLFSCAGGAVSRPHSLSLFEVGQRRGNLRPICATGSLRAHGMPFE